MKNKKPIQVTASLGHREMERQKRFFREDVITVPKRSMVVFTELHFYIIC